LVQSLTVFEIASFRLKYPHFSNSSPRFFNPKFKNASPIFYAESFDAKLINGAKVFPPKTTV